jgi:hypothetical protein
MTRQEVAAATGYGANRTARVLRWLVDTGQAHANGLPRLRGRHDPTVVHGPLLYRSATPMADEDWKNRCRVAMVEIAEQVPDRAGEGRALEAAVAKERERRALALAATSDRRLRVEIERLLCFRDTGTIPPAPIRPASQPKPPQPRRRPPKPASPPAPAPAPASASVKKRPVAYDHAAAVKTALRSTGPAPLSRVAIAARLSDNKATVGLNLLMAAGLVYRDRSPGSGPGSRQYMYRLNSPDHTAAWKHLIASATPAPTPRPTPRPGRRRPVAMARPPKRKRAWAKRPPPPLFPRDLAVLAALDSFMTVAEVAERTGQPFAVVALVLDGLVAHGLVARTAVRPFQYVKAPGPG